MSNLNPKEVAGTFAANLVQDGMTVGLGTGSTAWFAIQRLGERVREGLQMRAIPTSEASARQATELGIQLVGFDAVNHIDITIDGADEINAEFCMLKGGGGALLREKVVASITKRQICIVDPSKVVEFLGTFPLPVEVVPFGWPVVARHVEALGGSYTLRQTKDAEPTTYVTDNGNYILDCNLYPITDPPKLEQNLKMLPGVVEVGLFIDMAHTLIIGNPDGTCSLKDKETAN
ncbi:MAG: ribose-5-phosphate isomerase RpiA [Blastocatellia bacterium]|nr:ribose-5-phosphate isomerase RpiA [Blastocatellia bacterium]